MNTNCLTETEKSSEKAEDTAVSFLHAYSLLRYGNGEDRVLAVTALLQDPIRLCDVLKRGRFPDKDAAVLLLMQIKKMLRGIAEPSEPSKTDNKDPVSRLFAIKRLLRDYLAGKTHPIL